MSTSQEPQNGLCRANRCSVDPSYIDVTPEPKLNVPMEGIHVMRKNAATWCEPRASVNLGSSTVVRVKEDPEPDPTFKPRPVGFTAIIEPLEPEPLTWEGDGA